jgi:hypothetical protein
MIKGILIGIGIVIALIIIIKIFTKKNNLNSGITRIRSRWDDVCKKIKHMIGC